MAKMQHPKLSGKVVGPVDHERKYRYLLASYMGSFGLTQEDLKRYSEMKLDQISSYNEVPRVALAQTVLLAGKFDSDVSVKYDLTDNFSLLMKYLDDWKTKSSREKLNFMSNLRHSVSKLGKPEFEREVCSYFENLIAKAGYLWNKERQVSS